MTVALSVLADMLEERGLVALTREAIAMRIYVNHTRMGYSGTTDDAYIKAGRELRAAALDAFIAADVFLMEAERQREAAK